MSNIWIGSKIFRRLISGSALMTALLGMVTPGPSVESGYHFVLCPASSLAAVDSLGLDLGEPRFHSYEELCITNRNGNLPLTESEQINVLAIQGVVIIGSDTVAAFLESNGWNEGGGE